MYLLISSFFNLILYRMYFTIASDIAIPNAAMVDATILLIVYR